MRSLKGGIFLLLLTLLLTGCSSTPKETPKQAPLISGSKPDFSGHWEKDYRLSDDFNTRFALYIADIQRRYTTPQTRNDRIGISVGPSTGAIRSDAINGLARFTEEITRMPLLAIEHQQQNISIERENDFTLRCNYQDRQYTIGANAFGSDICGWNDQRLLFQMSIVDGLSITHQFSLSPDESMLDVTTTVSSTQVAAPLVVRSIYQRFIAPEEQFNCMLTLTRNNVCSQRDTPL